jgi:D-amino-acid dehydrogenase
MDVITLEPSLSSFTVYEISALKSVEARLAQKFSAQVVVIGGGVVGSACALRLAQAGFSSLLLDAPSERRPASYGNAGHIAIEQTVPLASPAALRSAPQRLFGLGGALDFRAADLSTWGPWAGRYVAACNAAQTQRGQQALRSLLKAALPAWRRLSAELPGPELLIESGHMVVWESARAAAAGRRAWDATDIGEAELRDLTGDERQALQQRLRVELKGGVAFEHTGQVRDPTLVLRALEQAHLQAGGGRRQARVAGLEREGDRVSVRLDDGERLSPDLVVVAGGVGSGALMQGIGHAAPVIAERGYHIEGPVGDWDDLPPVVFEDRSTIVTRFGERIRASSFVEFGREASPPDARKWARLKRHVEELGLPMAGPVTEWMGARPTLPDYLPAIGRSARADNLIYAFGHQHLGLTLAPVTAELVAELAEGHTPAVPIAPFDLERFAPSAGRRRPA